jgi:hypothetical protein
MIIVDYSGIAISSILSQPQLQVSEELVRHIILNSLRMYNVKYRDTYGKMVIACDGGSSWRKEHFPQYKANRKKNRENSPIDWQELFEILNVVREEIKANMPYKLIHVPGVEADDVIATLVETTQEFGCNERVMIISADKDFIQLQKYVNVKQFSPMTKAIVSDKDPISYLQEHILRGDNGDGVPNVLSPDDVFVTEGKRQKPLMDKKVQEWKKSWDKLQTVMTEEEYRNFQRNQLMVDLSRIPEDRKASIISTYESAKPTPNVLNYLITKRCAQLIGSAEEFNTHEPNDL